MDEPVCRELSQHIVADPRICHGQVTFRGTRILVKDVLDMVAEGVAWDEISRQWDGRVSREAIAEAVRVAGEALSQRQPAPSAA